MSENNLKPLFYFMNENISVIEVKRTDLPESANKDEKYFWIKLDAAQNVTQLKFVSMDSEIVNGNNINIRVFKNGELRFDDKFAKFTHDGNGDIIMNTPTSDISNEILELISNSIANF